MNITKKKVNETIEIFKNEYEKRIEKTKYRYEYYTEFYNRVTAIYYLDLITKEEWRKITNIAWEQYDKAEFGESNQ